MRPPTNNEVKTNRTSF